MTGQLLWYKCQEQNRLTVQLLKDKCRGTLYTIGPVHLNDRCLANQNFPLGNVGWIPCRSCLATNRLKYQKKAIWNTPLGPNNETLKTSLISSAIDVGVNTMKHSAFECSIWHQKVTISLHVNIFGAKS